MIVRLETPSTSTLCRISVHNCMSVCTLLPFRSPIPSEESRGGRASQRGCQVPSFSMIVHIHTRFQLCGPVGRLRMGTLDPSLGVIPIDDLGPRSVSRGRN